MSPVRVAHTADLGQAVLREARVLFDDAFAGEFDDDDWEHALGGLHVLVRDDAGLVAHGSVVQRRLLHGGRALRCGYVEAVGVRADARRRGHGATVMEACARIVRAAYDLGGLGATEQAVALYERLGWQQWRGPLSALTPDGLRPTPDEAGVVYVLPCDTALDLDGELTCDWRDGDVW